MRSPTVKYALLATVLALSACGNRPTAQIPTSGASLQAAHDALTEGEAGTSLAIARGILSSQPRNVAAMCQAGDAEALLGDRLAANTSYTHALALAPRDVHARLGLGKLQIRDDLRGAEASFRAVLADAPRDPLALNDLGYVLDLQDRHTEAQVAYRTALQADPDRVATRVNLALSMALSGDAINAEQMLRDIATSASSSRKVRLDLAMAQVMAGHDQDAESTFNTDLSPAETKSAIAGIERLRPAGAAAKPPAS